MSFREALVLGLSSFAITASGFILWSQDWKYALPTPRPTDLVQPELLQKIDYQAASELVPSGKPVLLHFFNPECECSRFGLDHLKLLHLKHSQQVNFIAVLQGDSPDLSKKYESLNLAIPYVQDPDNRLASLTGVYSTPQAVLIDSDSRLYFRGNYNSSRFCTSRDSEYARIAIESLLDNQPRPHFPSLATTAFGCPLRKSGRSPAS